MLSKTYLASFETFIDVFRPGGSDDDGLPLFEDCVLRHLILAGAREGTQAGLTVPGSQAGLVLQLQEVGQQETASVPAPVDCNTAGGFLRYRIMCEELLTSYTTRSR